MKGYQTIFGGLTATNDLYLWGKGLNEILKAEDGENFQKEPFLVQKHPKAKIQDFIIQQNYIMITLV